MVDYGFTRKIFLCSLIIVSEARVNQSAETLGAVEVGLLEGAGVLLPDLTRVTFPTCGENGNRSTTHFGEDGNTC